MATSLSQQQLSDLLYRVRLRLNSLAETVHTLQAGGTSGGNTGGGSTPAPSTSTLLASPDGSAWKLSASNLGAIVTTKTTGAGSPSQTIKSPDNSSWVLTVNNSGVLSTTKI